MRACVVIPVFNHGDGVARVLDELKPFRVPVILVDDGSEPGCARQLRELASANQSWLTLLCRNHNGGKGAAVMDGLRLARRQGFSHALQIDADGQHDVRDLPHFLRVAAAHPAALVTGTPVFDESVPRSRLYGRYLSHLCVWLNTLSLDIRDSMCGFRIYPLEATVSVIEQEQPGQRMEFDIEILVRMHWRGVAVINLPTRVHYPSDGISHFRLWHDNLLIARTHLRLLAGMLRRLPRLLLNRSRP